MNSVIAQDPQRPLEKRTWCYRQSPAVFEVASCQCGNSKTMWSEFKDHIWCEKCEIDFIPSHYGILSGPIPVKTAELLGVRFDRIILETNKIERYDSDKGDWIAGE
jgi:hypothetical protein